MGSTTSISGGLPQTQTRQVTFSGVDDDVITGTDQDFEIIPNGTGKVIMGSASNTTELQVFGIVTIST